MRKGGGHAKGAEWERQVGKALSLWLTNNQRPDIFTRNVLSGGSFTILERKGERSSRMPGDIMAAHPLAFKFLENFSVECKHLADLGVEAHFWDPKGGKALGEIIRLANRQARSIGLEYMLIARQNHREPFVFVNGRIGHRFLAARKPSKRASILPMYHILHRGSTFAMLLSDMLITVDPTILLEGPDDITHKRLAPG